MLTAPPAARRALRQQTLEADLVVVGGGLAGTCCALTAARAGARVVLAQDRPVLGGNASSEVRLWVLGATAHMTNNNRWAREGGVVDELLVENMARNPEGNPLIFDTILLERAAAEARLTLLLNTAVFEAAKAAPDAICAVRAFCSQNSTLYELRAPLFCDASGDGIVGYLAGAAFRMGAEAREEFGEAFAPDQSYGELLGHSIYFYSKDTGRPVAYTPPAFALRDITQVPRYLDFRAGEYGCRLWWIEYGGRLDTVHDSEQIKWELWKIVYGVWDYIKNSGRFPEAETMTLEWAGTIPGKRESRRFEGAAMLTQRDIVERRSWEDAVSFGGWSIDLHPADGVYSALPGCNQWHARGVYAIPYRCLYSRNIANLLLAGRLISASHVAFGSTRVMATCAQAAQAAGMAAALCARHGLLPAELLAPRRLAALQRALLRRGQYIPGARLRDPADLTWQARLEASSELRLGALPPDGPLLPLDTDRAQLLPLDAGPAPRITLWITAAEAAVLRAELRVSSRGDDFTPDRLLAACERSVEAGAEQAVTLDFPCALDAPAYAFVCLAAHPALAVRATEQRVTGLVAVVRRGAQTPPADIGVEAFEFWLPERRPGGWNFALCVDPPLKAFGPAALRHGVQRPTTTVNAWVAALDDACPALTWRWETAQTIATVELAFDTDWDHPMESVLLDHPERAMPFCVRHFRLLDADGAVVFEERNHVQTMRAIALAPPVTTSALTLEVVAVHGRAPAAVFAFRCYGVDDDLLALDG